MLYFDNCNILVNNTGLLAESVRVQSSNSLNPVYSLGRKGASNQVQSGPISNKFNISYFIDLGREPVFYNVDLIKNLTGNYNGINIEVGGLTGFNCFLTDYSIKVSPNSLGKASATFTSYLPVSGSAVSVTGKPILSDFSGRLAHGWSVQSTPGLSNATAPVYDFQYDFTAQWEPDYIIGRKDPLQVNFSNANETFQFTREDFKQSQITGEEGIGYFGNQTADMNINFRPYDLVANPLATTPFLTLSISGSRIQNSEMDIQTDSFAKTTVHIINYY